MRSGEGESSTAPATLTAAASPSDTSTSAVRSVVANWLGLALTSIISLILTPLLIHRLGNFYFGLWILVGSVTDYYGLLDVGMRSTLFRYVTRYKGSDDRDALNETMSSAVAVICAIALIVLVLTLAMLPWIPRFFGIAADSRPVFRALMLLLGTTIAVMFPGQLLGTYLCAMRRFDLFNITSTIGNILKLALIYTMIAAGGGVLGVALATLIAASATLCLNLFLVFKIDPALRLTPSKVRTATIRELFSFSVFSFLINIGDYLRFFTDSIVIGRVLTVALITPFSVASRLITLVRQLLTGVAAPLQGTMGELEGAGRQDELNTFVLRSLRVTGVLSGIVVAMLAVNGKWIIAKWIGTGFDISYQILLILLVGYLLAMAQQPFADLLLIKGRHQPRGWWSVAEGLGNLLLSVWWGSKYGLLGVALGTTVPMLVVQIAFQPWYALHVSRIKARDYAKHSLAPTILAVTVVAFVAWGELRLLSPTSVPALMASLIAQSMIVAFIGWALIGQQEREYLLQRFGGQFGVKAVQRGA